MQSMNKIISAVSLNGVIGQNNTIPWNYPEDFKFFRQMTTGGQVIFGRKTYESIGRPLPNRNNIVITRNQNLHIDGCFVVNSIEQTLLIPKIEEEVFIIGGAEIYSITMPFVKKMYITAVDKEFEADAYFPEINQSEWKVTSNSSQHTKEGEPGFSYLVYERIK